MRIADTGHTLQQGLEALARFADYHRLSQIALSHTQVALDEIVTNIFCHGYRGRAGAVELAVGLREDFLELRISDESPPFNLLEQAEPDLDRAIEDRPIGGLGIYLVRSLIDDIEYSRQGGKNLLLLRKKVVD
ncbi:MAG: ATP-binding protein [Thermoanaerobaculia bacterium]